ncbi:MAG TPA: 6-phosphofructokinase, partial [Ktedonobacter sp.]|nr:6-phosphofructokinase [Ktedonobacter sp.]
KTDNMVTLVRHNGPRYHCTTGLVGLKDVANQQRLLPDDYLNESKTMVTQAYRDFALPLIGEPLQHYPTLQMQGVR